MPLPGALRARGAAAEARAPPDEDLREPAAAVPDRRALDARWTLSAAARVPCFAADPRADFFAADARVVLRAVFAVFFAAEPRAPFLAAELRVFLAAELRVFFAAKPRVFFDAALRALARSPVARAPVAFFADEARVRFTAADLRDVLAAAGRRLAEVALRLR